MATFEETKASLIIAAKAADACTEGFAQLKNATTWLDLCVIARNSFEWCVENNLLTPELIIEHEKDCAIVGIFCNTDVTNGFCLVTGDFEISAYANSFVIAKNNSIVHAYNTTHVIALDNSTIELWDNTSTDARDNSNVSAYNYSRVKATSTVDAYENSSVVKTVRTNVMLNDKAIAINE